MVAMIIKLVFENSWFLFDYITDPVTVLSDFLAH